MDLNGKMKMNKIKIGFVGSHGTGKSSAVLLLAAQLKEKYKEKSVKALEENVREIARIFNNKINNTAFQKMCMVDHLQKEFLAEALYDVVVCDRTALDCLIYGLVYKIPLPPEYFSLAIEHLKSFTHIFFVRPDSTPIVADGFRDTDVILRNDVDSQFEKLLALWGGNVTTLRTSEVDSFNYLGTLGL